MTTDAMACPNCGSGHVASRRQLFHALMNSAEGARAFSWYSRQSPQACPPRSAFVLLLTVMFAVSLPSLGLWYLGYQDAIQALALSFVLVLSASLLFDFTTTYRRYQVWNDEWLCGECRATFSVSRQ